MAGPQATAGPVPALTLLLGPRRAISEMAAGSALARVLARADLLMRKPGWRDQLARHFDILPRGLPVAALTREADAGDAAGATWLRADPAYLQPDLASVRLLGWSEFGLADEEVEALLGPLRPLFGDAGFPISAPHPARWYLMGPADARLPAFSDPHQAMGDDLAAHLPPQGEDPRWRHLLNEAQILLHNHPVNAARRGRGLPPVNALWFWGAGRLPDTVARSHRRLVASDDVLLGALARRAGMASVDTGAEAGDLVDLRGLRDAAQLQGEWIEPGLQLLAKGAIERLVLDFGCGDTFDYQRRHRWRFWRRAAGQGT